MTDSHYLDDPGELLVVRTSRVDEDGLTRLQVSVSTNGFSGQASSWCPIGQLLDFATALGAYPLPEDQPPLLSRGLGRRPLRPSHPDSGYHEEIGLRVETDGNRGQVRIRVHLSAEVEHPRNRRPRRDDEVDVDFLTTYERLGRFSRHLTMTARNELPEAAIGSEEVGH